MKHFGEWFWLIVIIIVAASMAATAVLAWLYRWRLRGIHAPKPSRQVYRLQFPDAQAVVRQLGGDSTLSAADRDSLIHSNSLLKRQRLSHIYFIHGTFRGHDPLHLFPLLKKAAPTLFKTVLEKPLESFFKQSTNKYHPDFGNFSPAHVDLLRDTVGRGIHLENFIWSSGNHHLARLQAALHLVVTLGRAVRSSPKSKQQRLLLLGHSHGGQVLALFSLLLANQELSRTLRELGTEEWDATSRSELRQYLDILKRPHFDLVTLGTPPRYPFFITPKISVLHFINHRNDDFAPFSIKGLLNTEDGDYPQKWGTAGSDFLAPSRHEREINLKLDSILGPGSQIANLKRTIEAQSFIPPWGTTLLVDYMDQGKNSAWKTLFGHGIYTAPVSSAFNFKMICRYLYGLDQ